MSKEQAHQLVDSLPGDCTWEDLMREIYVRQAVEEGLADSDAGRTRDVSEVRRKCGLAKGESTGRSRRSSTSNPRLLGAQLSHLRKARRRSADASVGAEC